MVWRQFRGVQRIQKLDGIPGVVFVSVRVQHIHAVVAHFFGVNEADYVPIVLVADTIQRRENATLVEVVQQLRSRHRIVEELSVNLRYEAGPGNHFWQKLNFAFVPIKVGAVADAL